MLVRREYNRENAVEYARRWALDRNPLFFNFMGIGGDCTNFVSQCVFAGCCQMNFTDTFGWYYRNQNDRAPAWTGVQFFYNFITQNVGPGPFASEADPTSLELGDIIQLGRRDGTFYHTLIVTGFDGDQYLVSAHTDDSLDRSLDTYSYRMIRYLHIEGVNVEMRECECYDPLLAGEALILCGEEESVPLPEFDVPDTDFGENTTL